MQNQFDLDNFELKAKIKLAEDAVEQVNNDIQSQQDKIDDINFTLKYDSTIGQNLVDDLQEQISDLQRNIDLTFDRPIQELSDRSNILSNDLTLIDKAAESINEKYDAQEKALQKISELNQDIANQEKVEFLLPMHYLKVIFLLQHKWQMICVQLQPMQQIAHLENYLQQQESLRLMD